MNHALRYGDYEILYLIADERSTEVWAATHLPTGSQVAIKFPKDGCVQTAREAEIVTQIEHDGILAPLEVIPSEFGPALVYPFCQGGDLLNWILRNGSLTEYQANAVVFQILNALHYLHSKGIWHRDIKPENILLLSDEITLDNAKLTDLGYGVVAAGDVLLGEWPGSIPYASPEILYQQPYTSNTDIYSLGRSLYVMLTAQLPPDDIDLNVLVGFGVSDDCIKLLEGMLDPGPDRRNSADTARKHRWFRGWWLSIFAIEEEVQGMVS
jgi:serine/threonine protein kinase